MAYHIIKTQAQHEAAIARLLELGSLSEMTAQQLEEFEITALLAENYEKQQNFFDTADITPLEVIKFRMEQNNLTAQDMQAYLGSPSKVSEVLNGKRSLSLSMIRKLHKGLGIPADLLLGV